MLKIYLIAFGAIVIAGGVQGFLKGSKASLIAGGILGALVLAGAFLHTTNPKVALILALVGSLGIAGKFVPGFIKAPDKVAALWPAGILAILSVVALVIVGRALIGK